MKKKDSAVVRELKNAALNVGVLLAIPVVVVLGTALVTYSSINDMFIKCPQCGGKKVEPKGSTGGSRSSIRSQGHDGCGGHFPDRRAGERPPVYWFYQCLDCGCPSKKLLAGQLEKASDEEFEQMLSEAQRADEEMKAAKDTTTADWLNTFR